jgi:hypothetical protein
MLEFCVRSMDKFCHIRSIQGLATDRTLFLRFSRPRTSHAAFVGSDLPPHDIAQEVNASKYDMSLGKFQMTGGHFSILVGPVAVFGNHSDRDNQETGITSIQ